MKFATIAAGVVAVAVVLPGAAQAQGMRAAQEAINTAVLARCSALEDPLDRAIQHCTTAIRDGDLNETEIGQALFFRGVAAYRLERYDDAMRDFNLSIEYGPEVAIRYFYKGLGVRGAGGGPSRQRAVPQRVPVRARRPGDSGEDGGARPELAAPSAACARRAPRRRVFRGTAARPCPLPVMVVLGDARRDHPHRLSCSRRRASTSWLFVVTAEGWARRFSKELGGQSARDSSGQHCRKTPARGPGQAVDARLRGHDGESMGTGAALPRRTRRRLPLMSRWSRLADHPLSQPEEDEGAPRSSSRRERSRPRSAPK